MKRLQVLIYLMLLSLLGYGQNYARFDLSMNPENIELLGYEEVFSIDYKSFEACSVSELEDELSWLLECGGARWLTLSEVDYKEQMERHEYDGAGRVVKVFDRDGNLLKENSYNVVVQ